MRTLPAITNLEVQGSWRVEVPELSALALRFREGTHSRELLGVGDRSFTIFAGAPDPPGEANISSDLSGSVSRWTLEPGSSSQWEGLAADGAGCAFVLQEHPGDEKEPSHVFVFAPDLRERLCVIALVVEAGEAEWEKHWSEHENARGEALVLLRDGHLLVAKQKDPVRFIEFGPRGAAAAGLGPSRFLGDHESFEYPPDPFVEYEPLASWGVAREHRDELETINDLAVSDGRLYAISRDSHLIARLETGATPDEDALSVERRWAVPPDVRHPEGLAIADERRAIVADDLTAEEDEGGPNVFILGGLDRG
jgi:hypothetical protein